MSDVLTTTNCVISDFLLEVAQCDEGSLHTLRMICQEAKADPTHGTRNIMKNFIHIIDTVGTLRYGKKWKFLVHSESSTLH